METGEAIAHSIGVQGYTLKHRTKVYDLPSSMGLDLIGHVGPFD